MCWHRWSKWKEIGRGTMAAVTDALTGRMLEKDEQYTKGMWMRQERECSKCGKKQLREERTG